MKSYQDLLNKAQEGYAVELQSGVYLEASEVLTSQQNTWGDEDGQEYFDFSVAPFWITTDNGVKPTAIHDVDDLKREEQAIDANWL